MIADPTRIYDYFESLIGGVDGYAYPAMLPHEKLAKLINGTVRNGIVGTRPGYKDIGLSFENETDRAYFERFPIQGGGYYFHPTIDGKLITSIGGRIFQVSINGSVRNITPQTDLGTEDRNSGVIPLSYFQQAEQYFIIQNGQDEAIIIEGVSSRRADPDKTITVGSVIIPAPEVPTGTVMAFGQGRLIVANRNRTAFKVGDIAGGATSVLTFSDSQYLNEVPEFSMPRHLGLIVAMIFLAQQDTANGIGPLMIIGTKGILAMDITVPRDQWLEVDISREVLLDAGGVGPAGRTTVNGDVFFRSQQGGIRSLRMARAEESGWGKTPLSREVDNYLRFDSPSWLKFCQMVNFDNRLLTTVAPQISLGHANHLGMLPLNFDLVSSMGQKSPAAWEGAWTGITPSVLAVGLFDERERCLALCHDADGINRLYEITKDEVYDIGHVEIPATLETKVMNFQTPYSLKELMTADLWVTDVFGDTEFTIKWRPEDYPQWTTWATFNVCSKSGQCVSGSECATLSPVPKSKSRIILPRPPEECREDGQHKKLAFGYGFQFRIEWTGHAKIVRFRVHANRLLEDSLGECPETDPCTVLALCPENDFTYNLALDEIGCADDVVAIEDFYLLPDTWDLRIWRNALVRGDVWIIESGDGTVRYAKGGISGGSMIDLPDSITVNHSTMRIITRCVDPDAPTAPSG